MSRALSKSIPVALGAVSLAGLLLATPELVYAYIGPGAGFAIAGSGLFFLLGVVGGLLGLLFWPFRALLMRGAGRCNRPSPNSARKPDES